MSLSTYTTSSGFLLPSIHSAPPFFTSAIVFELWLFEANGPVSQQPNPTTDAIAVEQWSHLLLAYARHRRLFFLRIEDAETAGHNWDEVLRNERINRRVLPSYLSRIVSAMVGKDLAAYEPQKQIKSVLLYWRSPGEWAETLHNWATETGQLNTILTFYDITDPPIDSELSGIPISLLRKAIAILSKTGRAQILGVADGEGVRIFPSNR